jgi:hypothetical protein
MRITLGPSIESDGSDRSSLARVVGAGLYLKLLVAIDHRYKPLYGGRIDKGLMDLILPELLRRRPGFPNGASGGGAPDRER